MCLHPSLPLKKNPWRLQNKEEKRISKKGIQAWVHQNPVGEKLPAGMVERYIQMNKVHWVFHTSSASQSTSLLAGNHKLPSGPLPCQCMQYSVFFPCSCLSTILSMKNSCWLSMVIRSGGRSAWEGNRSLLFSVKSFTSEEWRTGKMLGRFGKSRVLGIALVWGLRWEDAHNPSFIEKLGA